MMLFTASVFPALLVFRFCCHPRGLHNLCRNCLYHSKTIVWKHLLVTFVGFTKFPCICHCHSCFHTKLNDLCSVPWNDVKAKCSKLTGFLHHVTNFLKLFCWPHAELHCQMVPRVNCNVEYVVEQNISDSEMLCTFSAIVFIPSFPTIVYMKE